MPFLKQTNKTPKIRQADQTLSNILFVCFDDHPGRWWGRVACWRAVRAKIVVRYYSRVFPTAGWRAGRPCRSCRAFSMGKGSSGDDLVQAHRVSGCSVAHLGVTACASTHTGHHVKVWALRTAML
jgi:hypothetical protein